MTITLDAVAKLAVDHDRYTNELTTLMMLKDGLLLLANNISRLESRFSDCAEMSKFSCFGGRTPQEKVELNQIGCMFHWFGTSVCNYAKLVGFIHGIEKGEFTRNDLILVKKPVKIRQSIKAYVNSVSELSSVVIWRNKVAAHFAITDPHESDNIATLNFSVMFPVTLDSGIYHVGGMALMQRNSLGAFTSEIPAWSISKVFESLIPRFWPDISSGARV